MIFTSFANAEQDKQAVTALLQQLKSAYSKVDTFTVKMKLERYLPDYALQNQLVWFKRPKYIKLKQLGPFKKGAELAIKPDGSIKGHLGGFLSFLVVSVDADDENLFGVTSDSAFQTDYDVVIEVAMDLSQHMTGYELKKDEKEKKIILDSFYNDKINRYRLVIDSKNMMIIGLERYLENKLMHKITWSNLKLNPNISDQEFDL